MSVYIAATQAARHRPVHVGGALGSVSTSTDYDRFMNYVNLATQALAALPEYTKQIRATAAKEKAGAWSWIGAADQSTPLINLANALDNAATQGKATLQQAVSEGSFARLQSLQNSLKNAVAVAEEYTKKSLFPPTTRLYIDTFIVGTAKGVVALPAAVKAEAEKHISDLATPLSTPLKWVAVVGVVGGVTLSLFYIRKILA